MEKSLEILITCSVFNTGVPSEAAGAWNATSLTHQIAPDGNAFIFFNFIIFFI